MYATTTALPLQPSSETCTQGHRSTLILPTAEGGSICLLCLSNLLSNPKSPTVHLSYALSQLSQALSQPHFFHTLLTLHSHFLISLLISVLSNFDNEPIAKQTIDLIQRLCDGSSSSGNGNGEVRREFVGRVSVSILIHGLRKGPLASALARDPPEDVEQLMRIAQKYIDEEERNAMKDGEWQRSRDGGAGKTIERSTREYVLREVHEGSCRNHSGGRSLAQKVTRQGYFWPTLVKDAMEFARKCESCQRFGIPRIMISDNGTQFQGKTIVTWCKELKIQQNFTAVGNPHVNGQTEVTNRTILQHLKTRLEGAKGSWIEELLGVLWANQTTPRLSTGETPFCLVYGTEAIIPAEIGEETQRVA
ncbi:UNVERIFIED_CONTAM: protein putative RECOMBINATION INITIATION DEFECT 1 [Sesamum radiatum]|uniref:Protein putative RECOMBINATION INITIATION DEFECT 1 n=1 Tax=Sesamum radiatum TaxID=300843 RepID=A0AAW2TGB5_SESRA